MSTSFLAGSGLTALTSVAGSVAGQTLQPEWTVAGAAGVQEATASASSFLSWQGLAVTYRSGVPPPPTPPANTVAPSIPFAYAYQWQRCDSGGNSCTDLPGATATTYVVASGDVGGTLRVNVTAANGAGSSTVASAVTAVVAGTVAATPPVTANLQLWFEANTETAVDGTTLLRWHDKSGFGRDLTAAFANTAPIVHRSDANGRAALEFDGVRSLMKTYESTFTIPQPSTFFVVYKSLVRQAFGRPAQGQIRIYANADLDIPGITYPFGAFQIWAGTFAGGTSSLYRNGALIGSGNAGGSALGTGFTVGGLTTTSTGGIDLSHFEVAEILYYGSNLSAADRQAVVNWLNMKYGSF